MNQYRKKPIIVQAIYDAQRDDWVVNDSGLVSSYSHAEFIRSFEPVEATIESVPAKLPPDWAYLPEAIAPTEGE